VITRADAAPSISRPAATASTNVPPTTAANGSATASGTITGRIFNPATGEYVRNAEVTIRGTALTTISEEDGTYRLTRVPAGEAVVTVTFTGYPTANATVAVQPGQVSTRDIELVGGMPDAASGATKDEILKLGQFCRFPSDREGNAKASWSRRTR